jgi:hypothetical protein
MPSEPSESSIERSPRASASSSAGISADTPPKSTVPDSSNQSMPLVTFQATLPAGRYRRPATSTAQPAAASCDTEASRRLRGISTWCVTTPSSASAGRAAVAPYRGSMEIASRSAARSRRTKMRRAESAAPPAGSSAAIWMPP